MQMSSFAYPEHGNTWSLSPILAHWIPIPIPLTVVRCRFRFRTPGKSASSDSNSGIRIVPSLIGISFASLKLGYWDRVTQKAYLRLPWVWIRTFGPRELGLWVWPETYRTRTLEPKFDTSPSTEKLRPQSLKWTGFLMGESPDHVFWEWNQWGDYLLMVQHS